MQNLHSIGLSSLPSNLQANEALPICTLPFSVDGGLSEIPQQMTTTIQRGEFFDLSQLLPENLHQVVYEVKESDNLAILRLVSI